MRKKVSNYDHVTILLSQACDMIKRGKKDSAEKLLDRAIEFADDIQDIYGKFSAFIQIARSYMLLGNDRKAKMLLDSIEEELAEMNECSALACKAVVRAEKVRLGLICRDIPEYVESTRLEFEQVIKRCGPNKIVLRYYIAFLVTIWVPYMLKDNVVLVEQVISNVTNSYKNLSMDPQYAELLTTLAEIHAKVHKVDEALKELHQAIYIYKKNLDEFKDTIMAILQFVRKYFPEKYDEFVKEIHNELDMSEDS